MKPHTLLLLLLFASRLNAALEQVPSNPKNNGWSETVQGLRIKAIPSTYSIPMGDSFVLFVMLQNVSDQEITLPGFDIMPTAGLSEHDHPHRRGQHQYNAMLIGKPAKGYLDVHWDRQEALERLEPMHVRLAPGDLYVLVLRLNTGPEQRQELLEEGTPDATHADVHVAATVSPGRYSLQFLYRSTGFPRHPDAQHVEVLELKSDTPTLTLRTPPVFISVLNEQGEHTSIEQ